MQNRKTHLSKTGAGAGRRAMTGAGQHILLTGTRLVPRHVYSGTVPVSSRLAASIGLTGISPLLAPGLVVGDYLVACSDYTGQAGHDPYTGAGASPVALLGNAAMSPLFFSVYAALRSTVTTVSATMTTDAHLHHGARSGVSVVLHPPVGLLGAFGGVARLDVTPQTPAAWGTYIFRLIRIVSVPANAAQPYQGDLYELGVTVNDTQLLAWGQPL